MCHLSVTFLRLPAALGDIKILFFKIPLFVWGSRVDLNLARGKTGVPERQRALVLANGLGGRPSRYDYSKIFVTYFGLVKAKMTRFSEGRKGVQFSESTERASRIS